MVWLSILDSACIKIDLKGFIEFVLGNSCRYTRTYECIKPKQAFQNEKNLFIFSTFFIVVWGQTLPDKKFQHSWDLNIQHLNKLKIRVKLLSPKSYFCQDKELVVKRQFQSKVNPTRPRSILSTEGQSYQHSPVNPLQLLHFQK